MALPAAAIPDSVVTSSLPLHFRSASPFGPTEWLVYWVRFLHLSTVRFLGLTNLCLPYQIEAAPPFAGFEAWVPQGAGPSSFRYFPNDNLGTDGRFTELGIVLYVRALPNWETANHIRAFGWRSAFGAAIEWQKDKRLQPLRCLPLPLPAAPIPDSVATSSPPLHFRSATPFGPTEWLVYWVPPSFHRSLLGD